MDWKNLPRWLRWGIIGAILGVILVLIFLPISISIKNAFYVANGITQYTAELTINKFIKEFFILLILGFLAGMLFGLGNKEISKTKAFFSGFILGFVGQIFVALSDSIEAMYYFIQSKLSLIDLIGEGSMIDIITPVLFGLFFLLVVWIIQKSKSKKVKINTK